jgi:hypothetical protein
MGKSTPEAPDYEAAAESTAAGNLEMMELQTRANRPTQITPWGTVEWTEGDTGDWTQNITLSPGQQEALDAQLGMQTGRSNLAAGMMGRVTDEFGETMDWTGFSEGGGRVEGGDYYGDKAGEAMYGRATSRLDPQWEQRAEQQESALRNQGLRPGDEAYDNAMQTMEQQRTDAYQQAGFGADIAAGQEGARMQGMDIGAGGYNTQLRQQEIAEAMQQRGFSLNEINAILHGQQVGMPSMPGFNTAGVTEGADYSGAAASQYSADMDQFSADQAGWQSVMNAGAGMMSFSDVRLKRSVEYVGRWADRKFYKWTYIWGEKGFGVLAHENPDMVVAAPAGYAIVDYGRL